MEPAAAATTPAAGWFPDPHLPGTLRWWDGTQWTQHTHAAAPAAPSHQAGGAHAHAAQAHAQHTHAAAQAQHAAAQAHHAAATQAGHGLIRNDFAGTPVHAPGSGAGHGVAAAGIAAGGGSAFPTHNAYGATAGAAAAGVATTASATKAMPTREPSLLDENPKSLMAILVSVLYLAMAIMTGIVLAGIVPAILTFRAFEGREKLAPAAAVAAALAIGFAFTHMHVTR